MTKEQCKVCEGLCCGEIPRLNAEIERLRAEIRSLDQANGGALREIERLTRDIVALQSQWDDMQQGFVEVFGEPVRDAIELLGATERLRAEIERLRNALEFLYDKWENGTPCTDEGEPDGASMGNAFQLSDQEENWILSLIPKESTNPQPPAPEPVKP